MFDQKVPLEEQIPMLNINGNGDNRMAEEAPKKRIRIKTEFPLIYGQFPNQAETAQLVKWMGELKRKGITVDAHVRLFVQEFMDHVGDDEFYFLLDKFASAKRARLEEVAMKKYNDAISYGSTEEHALAVKRERMLSFTFRHLTTLGPDALVHLLAVIARCRETDPKAYEELHLNTLPNIVFYQRLFKEPKEAEEGDRWQADRIRGSLEAQYIIRWLKCCNVAEYEPLLERIERHFDETDHKKRGYEQAACLLVRGLVHCTDGANSTRDLGDWYFEFLKACLSDAHTRFYPRMLDPNFQDELDRWEAKKTVGSGRIGAEYFEGLVGEEEEKPTEPRGFEAYLRHRETTLDEYKPMEYNLRPYQNELVQHALGGRNTIICAPTGSGKTLLAADIMKEHLAKQHRERKVGRCVMLVPTVPLVDQQAKEFVTVLGNYRDIYWPEHGYWVDAFSGCENAYEGRMERLLASDIAVMTPQILINMMNSVLRSERVYFTDFTMMIFDECHHCDKQHPYKVLMDMLEKERVANLAHPIQIIGLTASLGVGGREVSWDTRTCEDHMLQLCANLNAECISTVRHQMDNLREHVVPPVDEIRPVTRPQQNPFLDEIDSMMLKIEARMTEDLHALLKEGKLKLDRPELIFNEEKKNQQVIVFPKHNKERFEHTQYQTMVGVLKNNVQRLQDPVERFKLVRYIDFLSHYFHTILISDLLPNKYAFGYLNEKMANYEDARATSDEIKQINDGLVAEYKKLEKKLSKYVQTEIWAEKKILAELHEILRAQFEEDKNSRCLIFVATRNCAHRLSDHLNNVPTLPFFNKNNVGFMVSSNQSGAAGGQSSQEQQKMCQDFKSGRIKVLVVTSVAEEGVNIAECNLIIKYNNVGSERSMIQRRGRARKKGSKAILLALDTAVESGEYSNIRKEAMMMQCIVNLQEQPDILLKQKIQAKKDEQRKIRERQQKKMDHQRDLLKDRKYKLSCYSCNTEICRSYHIRSIADQLYIVCDPTVWARSKIDVKAQPSKDGQLHTKIATWKCKNCAGVEWGSVIKYSNSYLPQLAANKFTLERLDRRDLAEESQAAISEGSRRKWDNVKDLFNIDPINGQNIKEMYCALLSHLPDLIKQMEQQEYLANKQFLDKLKEMRNKRKDRIQHFLDE